MRPPLSLPQAILFDHDGVLVESEGLQRRAWRRMLAELGLTGPEVEARVLAGVGKTAPQILASILDAAKPDWSRSEFDIDALCRRKNDFFLEEARAGLVAYPGVVEGVRALRARGVKTAVVSNARRRELLAGLEKIGIADGFDAIISRDDTGGSVKPDPGPYLVGAASVGVEPALCLAVEDSPPGLEAALRARIPAAAVMTNFSRERLEQPVPGRPELRPAWIGPSIHALFTDLGLFPAS